MVATPTLTQQIRDKCEMAEVVRRKCPLVAILRELVLVRHADTRIAHEDIKTPLAGPEGLRRFHRAGNAGKVEMMKLDGSSLAGKSFPRCCDASLALLLVPGRHVHRCTLLS